MAEYTPTKKRRRAFVPSSKPSDPALDKWQERRRQAKNDRARYEPTWHLCQAYMAGRQWVGWNTRERKVVSLDTHPDWKMRERATINVLTPHVWDILARIMDGDLKPDLTFRRNDIESIRIAQQANSAFAYNWEEELDGDVVLRDILLKQLTYGTSAGLCLYDPTQGPSMGEVPIGPGGTPVTNPEEAMQYVALAQQEGRTVKFKEMKEGRIVWRPLGPFNLLVPPGIEYERDFPWLIVEHPIAIDQLKAWFGSKAEGLEADTVSAIDTAWQREGNMTDGTPAGAAGEMKDHCILSVGYELPCPDYPQGATVTFVKDRMLDVAKNLPYEIDGVPRIGVAYFHYHRIPGRFWSQGVVEPGMGIQRQINRSVSQQTEMKDRNLGRVYATRGTITEANEPVGKIMELIEVTPGHEFPRETQGTPPGPWIQQEADVQMSYLDRVLGATDVSRGNAPQGVSAYSALSLLAEQSEKQIGPVIRAVRASVTHLAKCTIHDIRKFWPQNKMVAIAGQDGLMDAYLFQSAEMPTSIYVTYPEGAPRPRSQAAEIQKAFDLYDRSVAAGRPLPITWLYDSLEAGKVESIPDLPGDQQQQKAEMENALMVRGQPVQPANYDDDVMHIQIHRASQTAHDLYPGGEQTVQMIEQHIQMHLYSQQMKMMQAAQSGAIQPGGAGGQVPGMPMPPEAAGGPGGAPTGPAGLPPMFPGTEPTAQRGKMGAVGTPQIAGMGG